MTQRSHKLSMGEGTLVVSPRMFRENRERLCVRLREHNVSTGIVLLQGGHEVSFYDSDTSYNTFRQESYFMWAFGALEAGCFGAIQVSTSKSILFVERLDPSYEVWMGPLWTLEDFKKKYEVDEVRYSDEVAAVLGAMSPKELLIMRGQNSDSKLPFKEPHFPGIENFSLNTEVLYDNIADLRAVKTELELQVMRYVTEVSSAAHRLVMRTAKPDHYEYQCEAEFLKYCYARGGCRHVSYTCICGSGENSAVLHYGHAGAPNNRQMKDGDICLYDMGANYFGYAADITCSFPVNGKFTADQKLIYNAVLTSNLAVFAAAKPGVNWVDMHYLSVRVLLRELVAGGLLKGDVEEMFYAGLGAIFMPHGLGHLIGLDVHDVGAYLPDTPPRPSGIRGVERLRTSRNLLKNMCLTIEPGCYFINRLLDEALADPKLNKYMNADVIARFRGTGGVRIEDDVLITETGCENMTKVPRTVDEIERWIAGLDDGKY